jgi:hypothetical protein
MPKFMSGYLAVRTVNQFGVKGMVSLAKVLVAESNPSIKYGRESR